MPDSAKGGVHLSNKQLVGWLVIIVVTMYGIFSEVNTITNRDVRKENERLTIENKAKDIKIDTLQNRLDASLIGRATELYNIKQRADEKIDDLQQKYESMLLQNQDTIKRYVKKLSAKK